VPYTDSFSWIALSEYYFVANFRRHNHAVTNDVNRLFRDMAWEGDFFYLQLSVNSGLIYARIGVQ